MQGVLQTMKRYCKLRMSNLTEKIGYEHEKYRLLHSQDLPLARGVYACGVYNAKRKPLFCSR